MAGVTEQTAYSIPSGQSAMREAMKEDEIEIGVQINGKTKAVVCAFAADIDKDKAPLQQVKKQSLIS